MKIDLIMSNYKMLCINGFLSIISMVKEILR